MLYRDKWAQSVPSLKFCKKHQQRFFPKNPNKKTSTKFLSKKTKSKYEQLIRPLIAFQTLSSVDTIFFIKFLYPNVNNIICGVTVVTANLIKTWSIIVSRYLSIPFCHLIPFVNISWSKSMKQAARETRSIKFCVISRLRLKYI